ncbi:TPA: hypothetical protein ACGOYW_001793, partial [Streptococcus suis]
MAALTAPTVVDVSSPVFGNLVLLGLIETELGLFDPLMDADAKVLAEVDALVDADSLALVLAEVDALVDADSEADVLAEVDAL